MFLESACAAIHENVALIVYVKLEERRRYRLSTFYRNRSWLTWTGSDKKNIVFRFKLTYSELKNNSN
jgi:hypothetical protein